MFLGFQSILGSTVSDFINFVMCHETKSDEGNGSDNDEGMMLVAIKVW